MRLIAFLSLHALVKVLVVSPENMPFAHELTCMRERWSVPAEPLIESASIDTERNHHHLVEESSVRLE